MREQTNPFSDLFEAPRLSWLQRCALILIERAGGNLPSDQALIGLRMLRPDVDDPTLQNYLLRARLLRP